MMLPGTASLKYYGMAMTMNSLSCLTPPNNSFTINTESGSRAYNCDFLRTSFGNNDIGGHLNMQSAWFYASYLLEFIQPMTVVPFAISGTIQLALSTNPIIPIDQQTITKRVVQTINLSTVLNNDNCFAPVFFTGVPLSSLFLIVSWKDVVDPSGNDGPIPNQNFITFKLNNVVATPIAPVSISPNSITLLPLPPTWNA
jgi:hypothetical protein